MKKFINQVIRKEKQHIPSILSRYLLNGYMWKSIYTSNSLHLCPKTAHPKWNQQHLYNKRKCVNVCVCVCVSVAAITYQTIITVAWNLCSSFTIIKGWRYHMWSKLAHGQLTCLVAVSQILLPWLPLLLCSLEGTSSDWRNNQELTDHNN